MTFWELYDRTNFLITLLAAEFVVCSRAEKRPHYFLRLVAGFLPLCLFSVFWNDIVEFFRFENLIQLLAVNGSRYLIVFLLSMGLIALAYKVDIWSNLFYCVMAYSIQHIANAGCYMILSLISVSPLTYAGALLLAVISAISYAALWLLFIRRLDKKTPIVINNKYLLAISAVALLLIVFVSLFGVVLSGGAGEYADILFLIINLYSSLFALFCIFLEVSLLSIRRSQLETAILKRLISSANSQYIKAKDNIDIINDRCHNLKYQVLALRDKLGQPELDKISSAIDIYDSTFKTGNTALDVILTEKNLVCREKNVRLTCMVRGELFKDWSESDIYVLFGNAIDNALQAAEELEDEKRLISIKEKKRGNISNICIENYYHGAIELEDGLPVTQRGETFHGYGMKSIRMLVEKYHGELRVVLDNDIFRLNILLFH